MNKSKFNSVLRFKCTSPIGTLKNLDFLYRLRERSASVSVCVCVCFVVGMFYFSNYWRTFMCNREISIAYFSFGIVLHVIRGNCDMFTIQKQETVYASDGWDQ